MAGKASSHNALITSKPSESAPNVQLHPLVLLTISDYITRHTARQQAGPIVGAVIGQQNGRNFTLEYAYECKTEQQDNDLVLDEAWFQDRLDQYREVHKVPALDFVGIFMLGAIEGPAAIHLQFIRQVQKLTATDSSVLLLFHAEQVDELQGGKLPITLYESVKEQESGDVEVRFRELAFEVETGEAEMISVDFVAAGAGNATAVPKADKTSSGQAAESSSREKKGKGKGKAKDDDASANGTAAYLSAEDEELLASLTAKANAIKMLQQRLNLIRAYLQALPPSYITDATSTDTPAEGTNHSVLRSINAMLSRLPLLAPPSIAPSTTSNLALPSSEKEKQDVHLTALLASLTRSISEAQNLGNKFSIVSREKAAKERSSLMATGGRGGVPGMGSLLTEDSGGF